MMELEIPQLNQQERQREITTLFDLGLVVKGLNGAVEIVGAIAIAFVPKMLVVRIAEFVTQGELTTDSDDPVATAIREAARSFSVHSHTLLIAYLLLHGIIKLVLVIMLFLKIRIAYPLFMCALIIFSSYEAYQGVHLHNLFLIAFAVFDFALFCITTYQYQKLVKKDGRTR